MEQSENKSNKSLKLEKALQKIKEQAFHINSAIEKNNLRQCLKEAYTMLCELRTNELSPKNYYGLYMSVVDVMLTLKNYMIEEISRGRRLIDLYDDVQQAQNVIPRLYLMITAGSIYIERVPRSTRIIIYDMLGLVKAVQNPIKGLFLRNYLLKMLKDKLPDKDNIYLKEGANFEDSIKFIIENMEEMNRLWIRLSGGVTGAEKAKREKERDELKSLIGIKEQRANSNTNEENEATDKETMDCLTLMEWIETKIIKNRNDITQSITKILTEFPYCGKEKEDKMWDEFEKFKGFQISLDNYLLSLKGKYEDYKFDGKL